jgi:hypothetical protein
MLPSSLAALRALVLRVVVFGCLAAGASAQTMITFDFETAGGFTGVGTHSLTYTQAGTTLDVFTQTSGIDLGTIPGAEFGPNSLHFGDPGPENAAYFNLSDTSAFNLVSFGLLNESGADLPLIISSNLGSWNVTVPYDSGNPNAVALLFTGLATDPSVFQGITYFSIANYSTGGTYEVDNVRITTAAVPEPATWAVGAGVVALMAGIVARRRVARD